MAARAALLAALGPFIDDIGEVLIAEEIAKVVGAECRLAVTLRAREVLRDEQRDILPRILDAIIAEEVRAAAPSIAEAYIRDTTAAYMFERKVETAYELLYLEASKPLVRAAAAYALTVARQDFVLATVLEACVADCARAAAKEALAGAADARRRADADAAVRAVRATAEAHVLTRAGLRHLSGLLGAKSTSLLVHRDLSRGDRRLSHARSASGNNRPRRL